MFKCAVFVKTLGHIAALEKCILLVRFTKQYFMQLIIEFIGASSL